MPRTARWTLIVTSAALCIVTLDNLSRIQDWLSDGLCRLATGGGLSKRRLYTDADEHVLEAQRPVFITSIEEVATRGDLLDRLRNDGAFKAVRGGMSRLLEPSQYVGRSPSQVREFLEEEVEPRLAPRRKALGLKPEVKV